MSSEGSKASTSELYPMMIPSDDARLVAAVERIADAMIRFAVSTERLADVYAPRPAEPMPEEHPPLEDPPEGKAGINPENYWRSKMGLT